MIWFTLFYPFALIADAFKDHYRHDMREIWDAYVETCYWISEDL